ncbi:hypothetical protein ACP4OV_026923 [Aristida adscensionis]
MCLSAAATTDPSPTDGLTGSTTLEVAGPAVDDAVGVPHPHALRSFAVSPAFPAGGFLWRAHFYSSDFHRCDRFALYLQLLPIPTARAVAAKASFAVTVVDPASLLPPRPLYAPSPVYAFEASECAGGGGGGVDLSFARLVVDKAVLRTWCPLYARAGRRLLLECTVTVFPDTPAASSSAASATAEIDDVPPPTPTPASAAAEIDDDVPPSDMTSQLGELLESHEGADVVFCVEDDVFPAHRIILAARSPVFKAELYKVAMMPRPIYVVDNMRSGTFRALLRYIYTDASPAAATGDDGDDTDKAVTELLVAADRYGVERLKRICERVLCKRLDATERSGYAAGTVLAEQEQLMSSWLEFVA